MVAADIFRGRYRDGYDKPKPLDPGKALRYRFALPTANHVFLPGHRVMVQVQSSWFPLYDRNPQTFVEQPRAHAVAAKAAHAVQQHAALLEALERFDRVVVAEQAHAADARAPQRGRDRRVQDRAARLRHARGAVGKDDVVHEQVAEQHEFRRGGHFPSARNASAFARTAAGSSAFDQSPPCFTDEPTMMPCARAKRA